MGTKCRAIDRAADHDGGFVLHGSETLQVKKDDETALCSTEMR